MRQKTMPAGRQGFAPIVLILTLALIVSVGYIAYLKGFINLNPSQESFPLATSEESVATPDPTADWKTYTNTKYFYQLKYPTNYQEAESGMSRGDIQNTDWLTIFKPNSDFEVSQFAFNLIDTKLSLENVSLQHYNKLLKYNMTQADRDAATKNLGFPIIDPVIENTIAKTTVLDLPAYTYTIKSNVIDDGASEALVINQVHKYIWIEKNNNIFLISFTDTEPTNQILSTFKFTQ